MQTHADRFAWFERLVTRTPRAAADLAWRVLDRCPPEDWPDMLARLLPRIHAPLPASWLRLPEGLSSSAAIQALALLAPRLGESAKPDLYDALHAALVRLGASERSELLDAWPSLSIIAEACAGRSAILDAMQVLVDGGALWP